MNELGACKRPFDPSLPVFLKRQNNYLSEGSVTVLNPQPFTLQYRLRPIDNYWECFSSLPTPFNFLASKQLLKGYSNFVNEIFVVNFDWVEKQYQSAFKNQGNAE